MNNPANKKFYDDEKNAREYIESREDFDGGFLIEFLKKYLKPNSTVLELGMGAGKDFDILSKTFQATGSDYSQIFLDIYREKKPNADLLLLDAVTLETDRKFDCIFSNKVLHHLSPDDLKKSFKRQKEILNKNGIIFHTFWYGEKREKFQDLNFIQYKLSKLWEMTNGDFRFIEAGGYTELIKADSIYLVLQEKALIQFFEISFQTFLIYPVLTPFSASDNFVIYA